MKVLFFASVRERVGAAHCTIDGDPPADLDALRARLAAQGDAWRDALAQPNLVCAVNQAVVHGNTALGHDDEVAFFPPVTGG
ncbi:MAG TPA: MoaD/ThiS family protein [Pseudohaliea sp.]|nr:MoaD/ThiS family protein [Pseudohaliea sp.]